MKKLIYVISTILVSFTFTSGFAQSNYPSKPIKIIVPYGPGGSTDVLTRLVANKLTEKIGVAVIVENKPGGNATIGTEFVANSTNDGYTLLAASSGNAINPSMYGAKAQNFPKDFAAIIGLASTPNVIAVNPKTPYKSLAEIISISKENPDSLSYAHAGIGSLQHLVGEQFEIESNIKMIDVPYKGGGPATTDVLGGQVPVLISGLTASINFIKDDRLRALAVTSEKRSPNLPDVPTVAESGFPEFNSVFWIALYAPRGTPPAIVEKINADINEILKRPEVIQQLEKQAAEPFGGSSKSLEAFINIEIDKFSKIVKTANIKAN